MAKFTPKQQKALELLTSGLGMTYKEIAERSGCSPKTLWGWRNENTEFMAELDRLNEQRWQAAEDAAREATISLCREGNQRMVEFVMKNIGYNPTQKQEIDANVSTDIDVTIDGDE